MDKTDEMDEIEDEELSLIPNVLACDVGNSAIHFAMVQGETASELQTFRIADSAGLAAALANLWGQMKEPRKVIASSVNPAGLTALEAAVTQAIGKQGVLVVGRDIPLPIETALANPEKIGVDRLCAALAAYDKLGNACVVADFGSAITIDCVDDEGVFLGGVIMPGLAMGAVALQAGTAQLPAVELVNPDWVLGRDTREAIVGGLVFGARGAMREMIEMYATKLGQWPLVIATGGDAALVCGDVVNSELIQAIVPDLVIRGIASAYYKTLLTIE
jgi:type III pantothenate kinase